MIKPYKPVEDMTPEELRDFRNSLDCDSMGFDNGDTLEKEGVDNAEYTD